LGKAVVAKIGVINNKALEINSGQKLKPSFYPSISEAFSQ
jgi:hypothetical protein